jgi:NTE family protein
MIKNKKRYNIGLALSGGGVKGFAHAGALQALEEFGIKPDIISGTSAGSIAGVLYSAGYSPRQICELFKNKSFVNFTQPMIPGAGFFSPAKFIEFLKKNIRYNNIEELPIPMRIVATDLDHGNLEVFKEGSIAERVMASSSVPIVFPPIKIDETYYVDGGIFCNFPVDIIREECRFLIGINVNPLVSDQYKQSMLDIALRSYRFMFRANSKEYGKRCNILVETTETKNYEFFDLNNVDEIYTLGYNETKKVLEQNYYKIKRLIYTSKNEKNSSNNN